MTESSQRRTCYFTGHVQGVGFRYTVKSLAAKYKVTGYVKNLPDGRVQMVAEGPADQISNLLSDIREHMAGHITDIEQKTAPATAEFAGFSIRH